MFNFAWVDPEEAEWDNAYARQDESVFAFDLSQDEGEFAQLSLSITNPKVGLLGDGRKVWGWFSRTIGTTHYPLFFGRLVGIPNDLFGEVLELKFVARPADYVDAKESAADALRALPYFDPVFIDETRRTDPDAVLETRSAAWHIDRTSHAVTISDILEGEAGEIEFSAGEILYDETRMNIETTPVRRVAVSVNFNWQQRAFGTRVLLNNQIISSFNDLAQAWPRVGAGIGSGWSVHEASISEVFKSAPYQVSYNIQIQPPPMDDIEISWTGATSISYSEEGRRPLPPSTIEKTAVTDAASNISVDSQGRHVSSSASSTVRTLTIPPQAYRCRLVASYDPDRQMNEAVRFVMAGEIQDVLTLPDQDETIVLDLQAAALSDPIPLTEGTEDHIANPFFPIGDTRRRSYIVSARGRQSLEYMMLLARATLRANSRAVRVDFRVTNFDKFRQITLRHNVAIADPRFPGGDASGKAIAWRLALDGDRGELEMGVSIGCAVGLGGTFEPEAGEPSWVAAGYVESGYQQEIGEKPVIGGDVRYTAPLFNPSDDGVDLQSGPPPIAALIENTAQVQAIQLIAAAAAVPSGAPSPANPFAPTPSQNDLAINTLERNAKAYLEANPTRLTYTFPRLNGTFQNDYEIEIEPLKLPKTIDLEYAP